MEGNGPVVDNLLRIGQVSSIDPVNMTCRVAFDDLDGLVSGALQVLVPGTVNRQNYGLPTVGEHVVVLYQPNALQEGFVLASMYTANNRPDDPKENVWRLRFPEAQLFIELDVDEQTAYMEFQKSNTKLDIDEKTQKISFVTDCEVQAGVNNRIEVKSAQSITLEAPLLTLKGEVTVEGSVNATGSIMDSGGNTNHHTH